MYFLFIEKTSLTKSDYQHIKMIIITMESKPKGGLYLTVQFRLDNHKM